MKDFKIIKITAKTRIFVVLEEGLLFLDPYPPTVTPATVTEEDRLVAEALVGKPNACEEGKPGIP